MNRPVPSLDLDPSVILFGDHTKTTSNCDHEHDVTSNCGRCDQDVTSCCDDGAVEDAAVAAATTDMALISLGGNWLGVLTSIICTAIYILVVRLYSVVQINVVKGCVSVVLIHTIFDDVYLDSRVEASEVELVREGRFPLDLRNRGAAGSFSYPRVPSHYRKHAKFAECELIKCRFDHDDRNFRFQILPPPISILS